MSVDEWDNINSKWYYFYDSGVYGDRVDILLKTDGITYLHMVICNVNEWDISIQNGIISMTVE